MAQYLHELGYTSSDADNDVWMRAATKDNRFEYYEYIIFYVDDLLAISHQADKILLQLGNMPEVRFKGDKIVDPDMYFGARLKKKVFVRCNKRYGCPIKAIC